MALPVAAAAAASRRPRALPNKAVEAVAGGFLLLLTLVALQNARDGTLGLWLANKFLNRGEAPPGSQVPAGGGAPVSSDPGGPGIPGGGTAQFGDPVPAARLISPFGAPRDGGARSHEGIDLGAARGTPIQAVASGRVYYVHRDDVGTCGRAVSIEHADGWRSVYCHLEAVAGGVTDGDAIARGTVIGTVGDSGNATGTTPHLHFELRENGTPRNPAPLIGRG